MKSCNLHLTKKQLTISSEINDIATACAGIQLSSLSAIVIKRLPPRELRDQVYVSIQPTSYRRYKGLTSLRSYGYLWTNKRVRIMDESLSSYSGKKSLGQAGVQTAEIPVPQFANSVFVGDVFASEAAALYFRTLIGAEIDYRCVRNHLEREKIGAMPFPLAKTIRRLTIKIEEEYIGWVIDYEVLKDCIQSLLMLKDHSGICVEIYLNSNIQYSGALFRVLETIKPVFFALRDTKVEIKVLGYNFFSLLEDDKSDAFSEQLNYYFMGTPQEWLEMKKTENREIPGVSLRNQCKRVSTSCPGEGFD